MRASIFVLGSIVWGLSLSAAAVQGQDREDFKQRMAHAAGLTKEDLPSAVLAYLEARTLYAGPELDYSLGRSYQRLYQCEEAQRYYVQVMTEYKLSNKSVIFTRASDNFDEIAGCQSWQKLQLSCSIPVDGYVMVNQEKMKSCIQRPLVLPDGEHQFELYDASGKRLMALTHQAKSGEPMQSLSLKPEPERIEVERVVERSYYIEREPSFSPALYWGLISGGALGLGLGGMALFYAQEAESQRARYQLLHSVDAQERYREASQAAEGKARLGKILGYTSLGVGAAALLTGVSLAVVDAFSESETIREEKGEQSQLKAYVVPSWEGAAIGLSYQF